MFRGCFIDGADLSAAEAGHDNREIIGVSVVVGLLCFGPALEVQVDYFPSTVLHHHAGRHLDVGGGD